MTSSSWWWEAEGYSGAAKPRTQLQLLPVRGSPPPPRRAVRGTRSFRDCPFQAGSVRTQNQVVAGDRGRDSFLWAHPLSSVGSLTLSSGIPGGGGGRALLPGVHLPFQGCSSPASHGFALRASSLRPVRCQLRGLQLRALSLECFETRWRLRKSHWNLPGVLAPGIAPALPVLGSIPLQPEACNFTGKEGFASDRAPFDRGCTSSPFSDLG